MITKCTHCNTQYKAHDDWKGRKTKCSKCGQSFIIEQFDAESKHPIRKSSVGEKEFRICAQCGREIGHSEQACFVDDNNICPECDKKLRIDFGSQSERLDEGELFSSLTMSPSEQDDKLIEKDIDEILGMNNQKEPKEITNKETLVTKEIISCKCMKCKKEFEAPKEMVGFPEICPHCKETTLVTNKILEAKLKRMTKQIEEFKKWSDALWCIAIISVIVMSAGAKSLPAEVTLLVALIGATAGVCMMFIAVKQRPLGRKWGLGLGTYGKKRQDRTNETVLELRASGKSVMLCGECVGTGGDIFATCKKCAGRGYIES